MNGGELTLFEVAVPSAPTPDLSRDQRRTLQRRELIEQGYHPLMRSPLHDDPARKCGNCWFRHTLRWHSRNYGKCLNERAPNPTHGAATDCLASWPACREHSWGDQGLSSDAARCVP